VIVGQVAGCNTRRCREGKKTEQCPGKTTIIATRCTDNRDQMKCDDTHAENRFRLSAKRTSQFKSARGPSVQSTTGSRGVRISGNNAGYTMFRGSVKGTGYRQLRCAHQR